MDRPVILFSAQARVRVLGATHYVRLKTNRRGAICTRSLTSKLAASLHLIMIAVAI